MLVVFQVIFYYYYYCYYYHVLTHSAAMLNSTQIHQEEVQTVVFTLSCVKFSAFIHTTVLSIVKYLLTQLVLFLHSQIMHSMTQ